MKKVFFVTCTLMLVLFYLHPAEAAPTKTWTWTDAVNYEDGSIVPQGDLSTKLYCGLQQGGPWLVSQMMSTPSPSTEDMGFVVQGIPGTVACVATHISSQYNTESNYSGEVLFSVSAGELNLVPNPPALISVAHLDALIREYSFDTYGSRWAVG